MTTFVEKYNKIEKAGELHNKGWRFPQIAAELDVTPAHAATLVAEYKEFLKERAEHDPNFLERITENTLEMLDSIDLIIKEAWAVYQKAKDFEMLNQQTTSLKLAMDLTERKAKLLNLLGATTDGGNTARLQRAERVNEIVSGILKEVVASCPKCRPSAQIRLAEAFSLMGREEEVSDRTPIFDNNEDGVLELNSSEHEEVGLE